MEATPNYSSMSLVELKQHAKGRRIKQYYIMKRTQLIQLLALQELPESLKIEKMTIHELRDEAKRRGMRGFWNLRRERLVELLFQNNPNQATSDENEKDKSQANKHHEPQEHYAQNVWIKDSKHTVEKWSQNE